MMAGVTSTCIDVDKWDYFLREDYYLNAAHRTK
jgi:HD superfamily phosphohydrolase